MIFDYEPLYGALADTRLAAWVETLRTPVEQAFLPDSHGKLPEWQAAIASLPTLPNGRLDLIDSVTLGQTAVLSPERREQLREALMMLHPWRKGPYHLSDLHIDTEWRSDWKWERIKDSVGNLNGRLVLDVGCGNGYHMWRMAGAGARLVVGLDPFLLYVMQFWAIRQLMSKDLPVWVLPLGVEALPEDSKAFDTVFSMGVLYHRRSPIDHLLTLRDALRPEGQLVLETLVIEGNSGEILVPEGRYAKMRNVWFIPSVPTLIGWLRKCRFRHIELIDVTPTTIEEQRSTEWMTFHSLPQFLDPADHRKTIEGYPAPIRATITAVV